MSTASDAGDATEPPTRAPSYRGLLASNPHFRRIWLSDLVSFLGDWFNTVAVYSMVLRISGTGQALAAVMVVRTLPVFLVAPVTGPLIDRFDRVKLMIWADVARIVGVFGILWGRSAESLGIVLGAITWMIAWSGLFLPAKTAVVPMLTTRAELPVANALSGGTWSTMLALGAALGGWATALIGEQAALLIDAVTFVCSAVLLLPLPRLAAVQDHADRATSGFVAGLRYLRAHRWAWPLISVKPMIAVGAASILMIPIFGDGFFEGAAGPLYIGLLYAARGFGAIVGSMGLRGWVGDAPATLRRMILVGFGLMLVGYVIFGLAPNFPVAMAGLVVAALGSSSNWVFSGTLVQLAADPNYHGRLFALEFGVMTLMFSLMSVLGGAALDAGVLSPRGVAVASGCLMLGPILLWARFGRRPLRG